MKTNLIVFLLSIYCLNLSAQGLPSILEPDLSPKEYRKRKKILKDTAREYYWNLEKFEELLRVRGQVQKQNHEQDSLLKVQQELLAEIARLKKVEQDADSLKAETQKLQTELAEVSKSASENQHTLTLENAQDSTNALVIAYQADSALVSGHIPVSGVYYTIQIGAYKNDHLKYFSSRASEETIYTEKAEGLNKYLIGLFKDYQEAYDKMVELLNMGLPEAWVVAYKDGQRVTHSQARAYTVSMLESKDAIK